MSETSPSAEEKLSMKTWGDTNPVKESNRDNYFEVEKLTKSAKLPGGVGAGGTLNFLIIGHLTI